jgi:hypothetical protein
LARGTELTYFDGKLRFLIAFAVIYGLVFINYIDIISPGGLDYGYHLWLVLMYFLPFMALLISDLKNWKLTVGLGLLVSLMNDIFYHLVKYSFGMNVDLLNAYSLWLVPQNRVLFNLNLGLAVIPIASWMMASSIYVRIAITFITLRRWNIPINPRTFRTSLIPKPHATQRKKLTNQNSSLAHVRPRMGQTNSHNLIDGLPLVQRDIRRNRDLLSPFK